MILLGGKWQVFCSLQHYSAGATTTWITSTCSTVEKRLMYTSSSTTISKWMDSNIFSGERCSSTIVVIYLSLDLSINFLFLTHCVFFFLRLSYLSTRFLSQHKSRNWTPDINPKNPLLLLLLHMLFY